MSVIAFIGLGSNLEQPEQQITNAIQELDQQQGIKVLVNSSLYRSKPVGPQDQDDFINAVVKIETGLTAIALLDCLQTIEQQHHRKRLVHWGPRTLDLDILSYADQQIDNERLTVPHPEIQNRGFVIVPWLEIEPEMALPSIGVIGDVLNSADIDLPEVIS